MGGRPWNQGIFGEHILSMFELEYRYRAMAYDAHSVLIPATYLKLVQTYKDFD